MTSQPPLMWTVPETWTLQPVSLNPNRVTSQQPLTATIQKNPQTPLPRRGPLRSMIHPFLPQSMLCGDRFLVATRGSWLPQPDLITSELTVLLQTSHPGLFSRNGYLTRGWFENGAASNGREA